MVTKKILCFGVACCLLALNGCGDAQEQEKEVLSDEKQETQFLDDETSALFTEEIPMVEQAIVEESKTEQSTTETEIEIPMEENGLLEVCVWDGLQISSGIIVAAISPEELLKGEPVIYDRFRTDGWVFEWLISDYENDNYFLEDGVLVISREEAGEESQVIHLEGEGGGGTRVSIQNKFVYADVDFNGLSDLLICTGHHGNQGLLTYYCFLQTDNGFVEAPTFTEISNPAIDTENRLILSQWRNSAASHSWAEFEYRDGEFCMVRELMEDLLPYDGESNEEVWVWTVNGEEIGRSSELTEEEILDLIYNENSEWGIAEDRWRTLYNNGLTADYSIYSEPE
ncbi:MAG: hypothetical protein IJX66_01290 [Lachnospiraceae bacterium]|nr:hypothetical protein [Lachnospiraceae bacterium]